MTHKEEGALFVHGSPRDPTMEYVLRSDCVDLTGGVPEKIRDTGFVPAPLDAEQLGASHRAEVARLEKLVKEAGIRPE